MSKRLGILWDLRPFQATLAGSWNLKKCKTTNLKKKKWEISHLKDKGTPQFIFWLPHNEKLDNNTPFFLIRCNIIINFFFFENIFHLLENRIHSGSYIIPYL